MLLDLPEVQPPVVIQPNLKVGNLKALRLGPPVGELRRYFWLIHPKTLSNPPRRPWSSSCSRPDQPDGPGKGQNAYG